MTITMKSFLCQVVLVLCTLTPPAHCFHGIDAFFRTSPYAAAAMVHGMKGICADLVAQRHQWKQRNGENLRYTMNSDGSLVIRRVVPNIDLRRTAVSLIYGSLYQGLVLEHSFNHIYPQLFGQGVDVVSVLQKVSFNMLLQSPFMTLPAAYISKSFVFRYSVREAMQKYLDDVFHHKLLLKYYMLWVPGMSFAFSVVPSHFRATFVALVSFFWMVMLSALSNRTTTKMKDE